MKLLVVNGDMILLLNNGLVPSQAIGIGLPILQPTSAFILRSIDSNTPKQLIIAQVIKNSSGNQKIFFSENEMDQLYDLAIKYKNNDISSDEIILQIRGGDITDFVTAFGIILSIITVLGNLENAAGFQMPPRGVLVPLHLKWLYQNPQLGNDLNNFGYGKGVGPKSIRVTGLTQNAGSEDPSSGSYSYIDIMDQLNKKMKGPMINIRIGNEIYSIKNAYTQNGTERQFLLAREIYASIRKSNTDVSDIASYLGYKAANIDKVKNHIFFKFHNLDRYTDAIEYKRFDAVLEQALAWKRMEAGVHTEEDVTWLMHEYAECHHESKYDSGYSESHERAEKRYKGIPWKN